jgi:hypothetical protein
MSQIIASGHSRAAKARWTNPVKRAKWLAALRDPATRAKMCEATKARWADPSMREKIITGMRAAGERRKGTTSQDGS